MALQKTLQKKQMFRSHNLAKLGENNFVFVKKTHQVVIKKQIQIIFR